MRALSNKGLVSLCFIICLFGCNSTVNYDTELSRYQNNAKNISDLTYLKIGEGKPYHFHPGSAPEDAQVAVFPWGESFVSPIVFPELKEQFEIIVRADNSGNKLFAPAIWFLDENYDVISGINSSAFRFSLGAYIGNIFLNKEHKEFRYMLVFADPNVSGKPLDSQELQVAVTPIMVPINGYMVTWNVQSATAVGQQFKHAVGGKFSVTFKNYEPVTLSEINPP